LDKVQTDVVEELKVTGQLEVVEAVNQNDVCGGAT
jgi:hypothetical protein